MKPLLLFAAALPCLFAAGLAHAWAPEGRPLSDVSPSTDGAAVIHAAIDIAAAPRTVWSVMNDCRIARRMITSLTSCKVIQSDPQHGWDVKEQVTKGNLFVPTIRNVVRNDYQPYTLIRFHRVGGDLKIEEGEWRLEPLNGGAGTRVTYVNRVAASIAAPAALVREGMKRDTAKVMVNLRRECVAAQARGV